jgi:hypothetical protein
MSTHQVVAVGDLHTDSTNPRNGARLEALDQIIAEGTILPNLAAWAVLGDVFHHRSTPEDRNQLAGRVLRMANAAPVIILAGNHEQPGDLRIFGELAAAWPIAVVDTPIVLQLPTPTGETLTLACLPYPHKANLIAGGLAADETLQLGDQYLQDIMRSFGVGLRDVALPLFLGHINVAGAVASNGQPQIGREIELAPHLLDLLGPQVPKLLGHIHKPQVVGGNDPAYYVGSVCRLDWGETEEKRYLVVEYTDKLAAPGYLLTSRPIAVAPMYRVEGELTREGFRIEAGDYPPTWDGCEVRVRYRFAASERNVLDHSTFRVLFEAAARLEVEPVAVPDRALRAPEVAAAHTLADKIGAWAKLSGATVTDGVLTKLARLEHIEPVVLLSLLAGDITRVEHPEEGQVPA